MVTLPCGFSRRRLLWTAGAFSWPWGLTACGAWADRPLAVAAHVWVGYEPMFYARDRGWFDESTVELVSTRSARESLDALIAGRVQAAAVTLDEALVAWSEAIPLTVVLAFNVSAGADMVLAAPDIPSLADLKGRRIGYEASSVAQIMLAEVLQRAGLQRQQVTLVAAPVVEQLDIWWRREVDALITYEPVASQLMAKGMERLLDTQDVANTIVDVLVVRQEALESGYDRALRQLLAAHFRGVNSILRNPQDASYRLAGRMGLSAPDVMKAFRGLILPDIRRNRTLIGGVQPQLVPVAQHVADLLRQSGAQVAVRDFHRLFQARYLPEESAS